MGIRTDLGSPFYGENSHQDVSDIVKTSTMDVKTSTMDTSNIRASHRNQCLGAAVHLLAVWAQGREAAHVNEVIGLHRVTIQLLHIENGWTLSMCN